MKMNKYIEALEDLDREEPRDRLKDKKMLMSCINRPTYRKYKMLVAENKRLKCENERFKARLSLARHKYSKNNQTALEKVINDLFTDI